MAFCLTIQQHSRCGVTIRVHCHVEKRQMREI